MKELPQGLDPPPEQGADLQLRARFAHSADDARASAAHATAFDHERRVLQAMNELIDRPEDEQRIWFERTAGVDPILATQVAALLKADAKARRDLPTTLPAPAQFDFARPPERIGAYRIVERIGGGGMGEVYLGVRDDGLFKHTVAIKVMKQGLFSGQLAKRFAEERRILASLQHPNIAQLFDGGEAPSGHSFIVMEHLEGRAITDYIAETRPSLVQVLRLFLDVCAAAQFSHQNLIVHADIKPSNIIVTDKGLVKLMDFGIAQAVDPLRVEDAAPGQPEPMTRAYAAPERRRGAPPNVAGDVYSLGALLYELLSGTLPNTAPDGDCEGDAAQPGRPVEPPSTAAAIARGGAGRPHELRGDLDAIVLKALAEAPSDRYASVVQMSEDIDRYFRGQPVKARPDSWQYRSWRFLVRHRVGLALTGAALILATVATVGSSLLYIDSEKSRTLAEHRFADTRSLANYMMNDVDGQLAQLPGALPLRRELVSKSQAYLQAMEQDRFASPTLRLEVAMGYLRLARIYGLDVTGGLGDLAAARWSLAKAEQIIDQLERANPHDPALLLAKGQAELTQASEVFAAPDSSTFPTNIRALDQARGLFDSYLRQNPTSIDASLARWRGELMHARLIQYQGDPARAAATVSAALAMRAPAPVSEFQKQESQYLLNGSYLILAENSEDMGRPDKALTYFTRAHDNIDAMRAAGRVGLDSEFMDSTTLAGMARQLSKLKQYGPAISRFRQSIDLQNALLANGPNDQVSRNLIYTTANLSNTLATAGQFPEARRLIGQVIQATEAAVGRHPAEASQQRMLALYLTAAARIERQAKVRSAECAADARALQQWASVSARKGAMPIDVEPGGPVPTLRARMSGCGAPAQD